MSFAADPRIAAASVEVCTLALCEVRLQDDARWPWLVLLPGRADLTEVEQLASTDRARLMEEAVGAGEAVRAIGRATGFEVAKLNLGALGNVVPQLHLHVVGRRQGDPAWPGPVWGVGGAVAYEASQLKAAIQAARSTLGAA